ncbi:MAG TPA: hypothetical protein VG651_06155 [Stellaceae bacterium]|nr:hypothetical protein [Stellaceae bacterium]
MNSLSTRIAVAAGSGVVALLVLAVTLLFLGHALMLLFEENGLRGSAAAGLTGLIGLILAVVIGLVAKWAMHTPRRPALPATTAPQANGVANGIAADLGALAAQQIVNTTRAHPYSTMGAALAAGIAVGAVPELRKSMMGLFKH